MAAPRCALRRKLIVDVKESQRHLEGCRLNLNRAMRGERAGKARKEEPRGQRAPTDRIAKSGRGF